MRALLPHHTRRHNRTRRRGAGLMTLLALLLIATLPGLGQVAAAADEPGAGAPPLISGPDGPVNGKPGGDTGFEVGTRPADEDSLFRPSLSYDESAIPAGVTCYDPYAGGGVSETVRCDFDRDGIESARIEFVASDDEGSSSITVVIDGVGPRRSTYTVLGDSYASGEGVPPFDRGTSNKAVYGAANQPYTCHRSFKSWARMLERRGGPKLTAQYACSGATIDSLNERFKAKPAQRLGLRKRAETVGSSDYVLITVGGNDIGFSTVAATCYVYGRGQQCPAAISAATAKINTGLSEKLFGLLFDIYHSDTRFADIVVVGYPNVVSDAAGTAVGSPGAAADARCPWITQANRRSLVQLTRALDNRLNEGTAVPGDIYSTHQPEGIPTTRYISTFELFRGHELCSPDPWVNPINVSPTALADGSWVYSAHPNFAGQRAIADAVASALNTP